MIHGQIAFGADDCKSLAFCMAELNGHSISKKSPVH
jgi:hypothetical protein